MSLVHSNDFPAFRYEEKLRLLVSHPAECASKVDFSQMNSLEFF